MTIEEVVKKVLLDEHADVICEAVKAVAAEMMEIEVSELIGAARVSCPLLVQVGDHDSVAPPQAARAAARKARAELRAYPIDHFDVYTGHWQKRALSDQVAFLHRHLDVRCAPANPFAAR
jgi:pimeloyl-ACP methyl ester carboxylesterase